MRAVALLAVGCGTSAPIATCPPDFSGWVAHESPIALPADFGHPTFASDRVIYDAPGASATRVLFDQPLAGGAATEIAALADPALDSLAAALSGDRQRLWFERAQRVWHASRSGATWSAPTEIALPFAGPIEPGGSALVDGETRLVVAVASVLHEVVSTDLVAWTEQPTLAANGLSVDPYLSSDGCFVLFASDRAHTRDLYVAVRGADGSFGAPLQLGFAAATDLDEFAPAMAPDGAALYFVTSAPGLATKLMVAAPP